MNFAKKIVCFCSVVALTFACLSGFSMANAFHIVGLENFDKSLSYASNTFSDVSPEKWYTENVESVYEYGLMNGKGNGLFDPTGDIKIIEAITVAVRINCIYTMGSMPAFDMYDDDVWYSPYLRYATESCIIDANTTDYNSPATRAEFAKILAASIDSIDLEAINIVDDGAIPDVPMDSDYAEAVYLLYRAGILTGSDTKGTFNPDSTITRAEAAAIITRIVDPTLRKSIELVGEY